MSVDMLRRVSVMNPREEIYANTIKEAVQKIISYLEDTSNTAHKAIYFDGWNGLAASAVLRAIAQHPPPSLVSKFDKIIHVDCSRWKSLRALQRTIAQELKLPRRVMDVFNRQDEEDDFRGVSESYRAEIQDVGAEIYQALRGHRVLVIFHNGSNKLIELNAFGIPKLVIDNWSASKVLWTFRGRLRLNSEVSIRVRIPEVIQAFGWMVRGEVEPQLYLSAVSSSPGYNNFLLEKEAREIAGYIDKLDEAVEECCLYLLSLNSKGGNIMDYNWATHASNYWVCDGIIQGGQGDKAWEVAAALQQQINIDDYSSNTLPSFGHKLKTPSKRWIFSKDDPVVHPESTSFFLVAVASMVDPPSRPLPNDMFHQSTKLRVLKLCVCTFSFCSPPFNCCRNLRFLGLDRCKDQHGEEHENQDKPAMEFFQSLWVLDICHTNLELDLSRARTKHMVSNIREVHIRKGRIWRHSFAWQQLKSLQKLQVIEPTSPWQTGEMDEFADMVKMEFLDLSRNSTLQVLPTLSGATKVKTLILDGCVGLENVGPEGLPLSLESFSLDAGVVEDHSKEAEIRCISMAGCARLSNFTLRGSLPNLEELDLSGTGVKTLDLTTQVVLVPCLQRVMLLGCEQLRAVLWPEKGMPELSLLCIDTRGGEEVGRIPPDFDKLKKGHCQAYVAMMDMKFIQILVQTSWNMFWKMDADRFSINLCISISGQWCTKDKMNSISSEEICIPPPVKSLVSNHSYNTYTGVIVDNITIDHDYNNASQLQLSRCHVEIGKGIINTSMESLQGMKAIIFVMGKAESLHVHDNSSITTVIPEHMMSIDNKRLTWQHLKSCHVVRCPKMHTIFNTISGYYKFEELVNFWAADLLMTHCVWSKQRALDIEDTTSFAKLQSIHLFSCPRLAFVLVLSRLYTLRSLETLHIAFCGDLRQVFPVESEILKRIATYHKGVLELPNLKHIYLHQLFKLQHICEAKIFAPKLETIRVRGCWGLRHLPAISRHSRPIVDCEKDWWEKLEWDGLEAGHDPSLFQPHHSAYYKKPLPRGSVLW